MDTEMIKLKIKCYNKFENIIKSGDNNKIYLYQQYFQIYESNLQNLNNKNIFNDIRNHLQRYNNCITNIINGICEENKEMFEDFISF
jgi:hypothetical protein